jgi:TPR repeat protein
MKPIRKTLNFTGIALIATLAITLVACTENTENNASIPATTASSPKPETTLPESEGKIDQLQRQAQEGDPDAQYNLAYRYENGLDVPKDPAKALELYKNAADQGHSAAQSSLDNMNKTSK